ESELFGPVISLPNGVAQLGRTVPPAHPRLLFVGRLEPVKGLDQLLRALPAILARQPQARLTVVGDGSQRPELEQLASALGVRQRVTFTGHVPRAEVAAYYRESSLLVMPGIWPEPFGLVGLEAMSAGRPVVASHAGGTAEWLQDGRDGFLVERRQPGQIADRVLRLLASRDLLLRMSRAAARRAAEFSLEAYAAAMERIYERLCQSGANTLVTQPAGWIPALPGAP
ncbi:MAG: glycosyltransferase family 4 protein, partial [Chloroflexota bacterium]